MSGHNGVGPSLPRSSSRHPFYRGIRSRCGKWVSEIRKQMKARRIWLGTFPTAQMAAVAYDEAASALNGPDKALNFPDLAASRPAPASTAVNDIRAAAVEATASLHQPAHQPLRAGLAIAPAAAPGAVPQQLGNGRSAAEEDNSSNPTPYFLDDEALFETPQFLLLDMAAGMMISPPRFCTNNSSGDSPDAGESLWSYW